MLIGVGRNRKQETRLFQELLEFVPVASKPRVQLVLFLKPLFKLNVSKISP